MKKAKSRAEPSWKCSSLLGSDSSLLSCEQHPSCNYYLRLYRGIYSKMNENGLVVWRKTILTYENSIFKIIICDLLYWISFCIFCKHNMLNQFRLIIFLNFQSCFEWVVGNIVYCTGYSLSEALIFASINPKLRSFK